MKLFTTLLLAITFAPLLAIEAIAQTSTKNNGEPEEPEKWYQVELLIYSTTNNEMSGEEQWPQSQELHYPKKLQVLINTNKDLNNATDSTTGINDTLIQEQPSQGNYSPIVETEFNTEQQPEKIFTLLDVSEHQLTKIVKKLSRKPNFKILFHESWRQPLVERKLATSILIRGGEQFDQYYELEGSIKLSVERYIHIDTDLWLSSFGNKLAVDDNPWNSLPTPRINREEDTTAPLKPQYDQALQNLLANDFSVLQTIVMRQHRRMRSKELHYIDHPLMGLLLRVTPYERPIETIEENLEQPLDDTTTKAPSFPLQ